LYLLEKNGDGLNCWFFVHFCIEIWWYLYEKTNELLWL